MFSAAILNACLSFVTIGVLFTDSSFSSKNKTIKKHQFVLKLNFIVSYR